MITRCWACMIVCRWPEQPDKSTARPASQKSFKEDALRCTVYSGQFSTVVNPFAGGRLQIVTGEINKQVEPLSIS